MKKILIFFLIESILIIIYELCHHLGALRSLWKAPETKTLRRFWSWFCMQHNNVLHTKHFIKSQIFRVSYQDSILYFHFVSPIRTLLHRMFPYQIIIEKCFIILITINDYKSKWKDASWFDMNCYLDSVYPSPAAVRLKQRKLNITF